MSVSVGPGLRRLARLWGVQPGYFDVEDNLQWAQPEALLDVLRALGAPVAGAGDVADAVRERHLERWGCAVPPAIVAWGGVMPAITVRRAGAAGAPPRLLLRLQDGARLEWRAGAGGEYVDLGERRIEGRTFGVTRVRPPWTLPHGYHRLFLDDGGSGREALVVAAPVRAWEPEAEPASAAATAAREWGVFLPLYALRTARSPGIADLTDLAMLTRWAAGRGARLVGTLPLLATFVGGRAGGPVGAPFEPSPYAPASRLFWSELFLDPSAAPELEHSEEARALLASPEARRGMAARRRADIVDYAAESRAKRPVIEALARAFFRDGGDSRPAFRGFLDVAPDAARYAAFRAVVERRGAPWPAWPSSLADREPRAGDFDEDDRRFHLYAQYLLHRQLTATASSARDAGAELYLDLPLGVHPDGYDTWAYRDLFARGVSAGAPPDPFIATGQSWGFPPLNPRALRARGYEYVVRCLRSHLLYAGALRLDHVMGLHRLFWVPQGREPTEGVYVRYPADELYAILSLESHNARARIVGEDLGTVPDSVRRAMGRHGVRGMYVAQFALSTDPARAIERPPTRSMASLNTHDMPPFAAFWSGADIADRHALGWLDDDGVARERGWREAQRAAVVACLRGTEGAENGGEGTEDGERGTERTAEGAEAEMRWVLWGLLGLLGRSSAELMLVSLEDLWLETRPQNVPGTWRERPNWRRKAAHTLESMAARVDVRAGLEIVDRARRAAAGWPS